MRWERDSNSIAGWTRWTDKLVAHRGSGHCPSDPVRLAEFIKNFLVKLKIESESLFRRTPDWERGATAIINHKALQPPRKLRCCWLSGLQEPVLNATYVTDGWVSPVIQPACGREIVAGRVEGARLVDTKQQRADELETILLSTCIDLRLPEYNVSKYIFNILLSKVVSCAYCCVRVQGMTDMYFDNAKNRKQMINKQLEAECTYVCKWIYECMYIFCML